MRITDVILDLKDGTPIRRRSWDEGEHLIATYPEATNFRLRYKDICEEPHKLDPEELFADDWEIYKEDKT